MKRFALGMAAGLTTVFSGVLAVLAGLWFFWPASLPPPAISPYVQLDLKLRFLRQNSSFDPHILAVGSSIAWRQLDGAAFETLADGPGHFVNGAAVNLKIHQSHDLLKFYLANFGRVRTVLLLTGLPDFSDCRDTPARVIDHEDAGAYAFDGWPATYFYLRYFSPQRYAAAVLHLAARQTPFTGDLFLDAYGSGPVMVPKERRRGLRYGKADVDPACVTALINMSHDLTERGLRFVVVFPPVHPEYRRLFPDSRRQLQEIVRRVEKEIAGDRTQIVVLFDNPEFRGEEFYDAIHLQWPGAVRLSAMIASAMSDPLTRNFAHGRETRNSDGSATVLEKVLEPRIP